MIEVNFWPQGSYVMVVSSQYQRPIVLEPAIRGGLARFTQNHPTSLHGSKLKKKGSQQQGQDRRKNLSNESPQEQIVKSNVTACNESIACASTSMKCQVISMCVIPVIIKHIDSSKEIVTLAIFDSFS